MRRAVLVGLVVAVSGSAASAQERALRVPNVHEKNIGQAFARLHRAGLRVTTADSFSLTSLGFPQVRAQTPRAGELVETGTEIVLSLYQPPTVAPFGPSRPIRVPRLTRVHLSVAASRLKRAGLTYWVVNRMPQLRASAHRSFFDAYRVIAQHPAAGRSFTQRRELGDGSFRVTPVKLSVRLLR